MNVKHPVRSVLNLVFRRVPVEAQLIVTRRCNLSCGYCTEYDKVSEMIPLSVLKERIDALHRLRVINVSLLGGEPLMHPDLPEIVAYADRHAQVSVTTNGFLVTEALIGRLNAAKLSNLEISIDAVTPDRTGYIQKNLKTLRPKLALLQRFAKFDINVNLVLCDQTKDRFKGMLEEVKAMGLRVSIDLLHGSDGAVAIGGQEYLDLWEHYYRASDPFSYLEEKYGADLLKGDTHVQWKCRAGARFFYVDEFGKVQLCSAQRGRLNKPLAEYTTQDLRAQSRSYKGCESGCSLLCHYRASALDNRPLHTVKSMVKLILRGRATRRRAGIPLPPRPPLEVATRPE